MNADLADEAPRPRPISSHHRPSYSAFDAPSFKQA
jgi:hypothetical protein